jgi:DNA-binding NarL/FixJ family response regulator
VEDSEPFRRFIASTLQPRTEVQVICEVSDGLEAVQKAQELQPDLVVLDIGLPTLDGIEAARRIRKLSPKSKIIFLSLVSDADVVREALSLGALGYVAKTYAGSELIAAVEAVLRGETFVSSSIKSRTEVSRGHAVEFYPDDASFVDGFVRVIEPSLRGGNAAIVVATGSRKDGILQRLREGGLDMGAANEKGSYVFVDAADILRTFMVNDLIDPVRFLGVAGALLTAAAKATGKKQPRVVLCGECASILWAQGNADAAIEVEQFCNQLTKRYDVDILCGFSLSSFSRKEDRQVFERICREI